MEPTSRRYRGPRFKIPASLASRQSFSWNVIELFIYRLQLSIELPKELSGENISIVIYPYRAQEAPQSLNAIACVSCLPIRTFIRKKPESTLVTAISMDLRPEEGRGGEGRGEGGGAEEEDLVGALQQVRAIFPPEVFHEMDTISLQLHRSELCRTCRSRGVSAARSGRERWHPFSSCRSGKMRKWREGLRRLCDTRCKGKELISGYYITSRAIVNEVS
jgi:hypothetical protein